MRVHEPSGLAAHGGSPRGCLSPCPTDAEAGSVTARLCDRGRGCDVGSLSRASAYDDRGHAYEMTFNRRREVSGWSRLRTATTALADGLRPTAMMTVGQAG